MCHYFMVKIDYVSYFFVCLVVFYLGKEAYEFYIIWC